MAKLSLHKLREQQAGSSKILVPIMLVIGIAAIVVLQFGFIFLLLALLPSLIAFYIDGTPSRSVFKTVFTCNLAGTLPFLIPMIQAVAHLKRYDIASIMSRPDVWLLIYSSAAGGWCLIYLCRFIARFFITVIYEYQALALERLQKKLIEEWGQQILDNTGE